LAVVSQFDYGEAKITACFSYRPALLGRGPKATCFDECDGLPFWHRQKAGQFDDFVLRASYLICRMPVRFQIDARQVESGVAVFDAGFSRRENLRYRRGEKTRRGGVRAKAVVDGLEVDQASALHAVSFSWSAVAFGGDVRDDSPAISEEGRRK
jgi:hypothetical protein